MKLYHLIYLSISLLGADCSAAPVVQLTTEGFPVSQVTVKSYQKGQQIGDESNPPCRRLAEADMTITEGQWTAKNLTVYRKTGTYYGAQKYRWWSVEISSAATDRVKQAIAAAANGYDANLGRAINASLRICPRFERKSFSWGQAVSFLAQYQNDNTNYVPSNGMLTYEVHGITNDGRYVRARFGVTHPDLVEFGPELRDYRDGDPADPTSPMRKDPHYKLVEQAPPGSFEPSLLEIDRLIDTLETHQR
jgi:hypothetical protein